MKPEAESVLVMVGTKKGGFIFMSDPERKNWEISGPHHIQVRKTLSPVYHMEFDPRDESIYAAVNSETWGPSISKSSDYGKSWTALKNVPKFEKKSKLKLERVWHIEPGLKGDDRLYVGVAPAALFFTDDGGKSWVSANGLNNHKTRKQWAPGAGGLCLHSILLDPSDRHRMYVAISAAGVFRTTDGGKTWSPVNKGTRADFMPNKYPPLGQCVHKLVFNPEQRNILYQQNHCGVYRSDSYGEEWKDIGKGLPSSYGFPMAVHPRDPQTIYVIPEESDESHVTVNGSFTVYRSRNKGETWQKLQNGLPNQNAYLGVLREGMVVDNSDPFGVYVGTNTGQLFYSTDEGDTWSTLAGYLPSIYSVSCATIT